MEPCTWKHTGKSLSVWHKKTKGSVIQTKHQSHFIASYCCCTGRSKLPLFFLFFLSLPQSKNHLSMLWCSRDTHTLTPCTLDISFDYIKCPNLWTTVFVSTWSINTLQYEFLRTRSCFIKCMKRHLQLWGIYTHGYREKGFLTSDYAHYAICNIWCLYWLCRAPKCICKKEHPENKSR